MADYLVDQRVLWVAFKPGCSTGYGATPKLAAKDARRRRVMQIERAKELERMRTYADQQLRERLDLAYEENELLQAALNAEIRKAKRLQGENNGLRLRLAKAMESAPAQDAKEPG